MPYGEYSSYITRCVAGRTRAPDRRDAAVRHALAPNSVEGHDTKTALKHFLREN